MKVSCDEGVASHVGPESCVDDRKVGGEALTGEGAGRVLSLENVILWSADAFLSCGRQQRATCYRKGLTHSTWSKTLRTRRSISQGGDNPSVRKPGDPRFDLGGGPSPCREL